MGFVLLAVVGVWLANERSYARLQAYKQQLIAKGEKLDIADHIPKLPPASSNGAPDFLAAAARLGKVPAPFSPIQLIATRSSSLAAGHRIVKWRCPESPTGRNPDRWPVLFAHVEVNRHVLAEMSTALERPEFVFEGDYAKDYEMYSQNSN